jgi:membrane protein implicated in regulation of membrane protease activity
MADGENGNAVLMIILGLILLLIGVLLAIPILYTLGVILLIVCLVLMVVGRTGTAFAGRRHYW